MNNDINDTSILVKHIPEVFSLGDCEEFFNFFKSKSVTYFTKSGPMQHTAIVTFANYEDAHKALYSLHERKILNSRLCVQFLKVKTNIDPHIGETSDSTKSTDIKSQNSNIIPDWINKLLSISPKWGLNGPIQPKLKYKYPKPDNNILTNIVRTLVANENFYTQTLHLMNKFHFPSPFDTSVIFPGNILVVDSTNIDYHRSTQKRKLQSMESTEMEISSGNESEISDDEIFKIKRRKISFPRIQRLPLSNNSEYLINKSAETVGLDEIFDRKVTKSDVHIEFRPISSIDKINGKRDLNCSDFVVDEKFGIIDNAVHVESMTHTQIEKLDEVANVPLLEVIPTLVDQEFKLRKEKIRENTEETSAKDKLKGIDKPEKIIPKNEIENNILPKSEWHSVNALKNYQRGSPSNQLYVKNISKKVTRDDLISLFGGFVEWSDESQVASFQVTYFTEGRMKGQAFVSFSSSSIAEKALETTNAYNFCDKPIVVLFSKNVN